MGSNIGGSLCSPVCQHSVCCDRHNCPSGLRWETHLLSMPPPPDCLANSAMSNPALNLLLDPVTTMAFTSLRACASRKQLKSALSTADRTE